MAKSIRIPRAAKLHNGTGAPYTCRVCDRPLDERSPDTSWFWEHSGGWEFVTKEEGERRNANGEEGADLGMQCVGPDCLHKHPELKPFVLARGPCEGWNL